MMLNLSGRSTKSAKRLDLARVFRTTDQLTNRPTEITQPDSTEPSTKGARAKVMWGTTRRGRTILETGQEGESEAERERERERELHTVGSRIPSSSICLRLRFRLALRSCKARKSITRFLARPFCSFVIRSCACSSDNGFFFMIDLIASILKVARSVCVGVRMMIGSEARFCEKLHKNQQEHMH